MILDPGASSGHPSDFASKRSFGKFWTPICFAHVLETVLDTHHGLDRRSVLDTHLFRTLRDTRLVVRTDFWKTMDLTTGQRPDTRNGWTPSIRDSRNPDARQIMTGQPWAKKARQCRTIPGDNAGRQCRKTMPDTH